MQTPLCACCNSTSAVLRQTCMHAALENLTVDGFEELKECRALSPCSWRSLRMCTSKLYVRTLAHLPLHSLTQVRDHAWREHRWLL